MDLGEWIKQQRTRLGKTQAQLGVDVGVGQTTISKWEKPGGAGSEPSRAELSRLEAIFSEAFPADSPVTRSQTRHKVPVMGHVGSGQRVHLQPLDALDFIEGPPGYGADVKAFIVRGASIPPFKDGTAMLFADWTTNPASLLGELCVVELAGRQFGVWEIHRGGRGGLWTLAYPGQTSIRDVAIISAAQIIATERSPRWTPNPTNL